MIHIVFQRPDTEALKKSFELDASLQGDIIQIEDDFAVGPLKDIFSTEGWEIRREWWRYVLAGGDYDGRVDSGDVANDRDTVAALIERLRNEPEEIVWIWAARSPSANLRSILTSGASFAARKKACASWKAVRNWPNMIIATMMKS